MKSNLQGLIAAPFTPLNKEFYLQTEVIDKYAQSLIENKVRGVFVGGSSGEGISLSIKERKALTEAWAKYESNSFKVVVHVGGMNYEESKVLAAQAQESGVHAIGSIAPVFFQPSTVDDLITYCEGIAMEAPDTPFFYYHIPRRSGVDIDIVEFLQEGVKRIPNLSGVKFTHSDLMEMQRSIALYDNLEILYGCDESLLCGLALGIKGAIGTTYNFMPLLFNKMINAYEEGDMNSARSFQLLAVKVVTIMLKFNGPVVAGKAIQGLCGIDCGPCKQPLKNLTEGQLMLLKSELKDIGFFEYAIDVA